MANRRHIGARDRAGGDEGGDARGGANGWVAAAASVAAPRGARPAGVHVCDER